MLLPIFHATAKEKPAGCLAQARRWLALAFLLATSVSAQVPQSWQLKESVGYNWKHELIFFPLHSLPAIAPGKESRFVVTDETGQPIPFQFYAPQGRGDTHQTFLALLVDLPPYSSRQFTLARSRGRRSQDSQTDLGIKKEKDEYVLSAGRTAVRIPIAKRFKAGTPFDQLAAPILAVRGFSGRWLGEGSLLGKFPVLEFTTEIEAEGPLFAQARVRYQFDDRKFYQVRVRVVSGENVVLVEEDFALSEKESQGVSFVKAPDLAPPKGQESHFSDWLVRRGMGWMNIPTDFKLYPCFKFNFFKNWDADRVRGHNFLASKDIYERKVLAGASADWRLGFALTPFQERNFRHNAMAFDSEKGKDYLGLYYRFLSRWVHPNENRVLLPWLDEGVVGHFLAFEGRREWGLMVAETGPDTVDDYIHKGGHERKFGVIHQAHVKFGETPLDKVKDWVLEWEIPEDAYWPRLFMTREGLGRVKRDFSELPDDIKKIVAEDQSVHALLTGDMNFLAQHFDQYWEGYTKLCTFDFLEGGHNSFNTYTHRYQEIVRSTCHDMDVVLACPGLDVDKRKKFLAWMAFLTYKTSDPDYWAYRGYGGGPSNPNMMSIACNALASGAALLAGHPRQREWLELCERLACADILNSIGPRGAWLESPGYQGAGDYPLNQTVLILRNAGVADLTKDPFFGQKLISVATYVANLLTPPDPRFSGLRMPVALGDGNPFKSTSFTFLAYSSMQQFPTEAGNAIWCWQQMGRTRHSVPILLHEHVLDGTIPPVPIEGTTQFFPGFGVMFRHGFGQPHETFFTYHQSGFSYGHYDDDQGSISLHAKGAPLCLDWIDYSPNEAEFHNRVDYHPDDYPWTVEAPDPFISHPEADYLRSWENGVYGSAPSKPIEPGSKPDWQRQILLVKDTRDPGDATYLVFRDAVQAARPNTWNMWTMAKKGSERIEGHTARLEGQFDVDVTFFFYRKPPKPLESRFYSHPMPGHVNFSFKSQDQTRIQASSESGGDYGVVLYPLRRGVDPEPSVKELDSGVVEISWGPSRRHLIFLFPEVRAVKEAGLTFSGRAAVAKFEGEKKILIPLECEQFVNP